MTIQSGIEVPWPRVSVVIPTLNEARNLPHVFAALPKGLHEVIVVDGHSVDDTLAVARQLRPDVRIVMQTRKGKGNALACGFAAATGDIIAMVDADGSADPGEIPRFVEALLDGADFGKGTRFAHGGGSSDITHLRSLGNRVLITAVNTVYGTRYSDLCYGFNVFWRRITPVLDLDATSPPPPGGGSLWGDGFEVETLINIRIAKAGLTVTEVPSFEHSRIHGVSNLNAFGDGLRVLRIILAERHRSRRLAARKNTRNAATRPSGSKVITAPADADVLAPADADPGGYPPGRLGQRPPQDWQAILEDAALDEATAASGDRDAGLAVTEPPAGLAALTGLGASAELAAGELGEPAFDLAAPRVRPRAALTRPRSPQNTRNASTRPRPVQPRPAVEDLVSAPDAGSAERHRRSVGGPG